MQKDTFIVRGKNNRVRYLLIDIKRTTPKTLQSQRLLNFKCFSDNLVLQEISFTFRHR